MSKSKRCVAAVVALLATLVFVHVGPHAQAQTAGSLTVSPTEVVPGQPFSLAADGCPGPNPVGADYSVEFRIDYQPPPGESGTYAATVSGAAVGGERFVATWSIPPSAPTVGGLYVVNADCIGDELGGQFVWFSYSPIALSVSEIGPPVLSAAPTSIVAGDSFDVTADGCPGANPIGVDYYVLYRIEYQPPPQLPGDPDPGSYQDTVRVDGAYGLHPASITIPPDAPTLGGAYRLTAQCRGTEFDADFLIHAVYAPIAITVLAPPMCAGLAVTVQIGAGQLPTAGDDVILGTTGDDLIDAGEGDDVVCALDGDDEVIAGHGDDLVLAGPGDDVVRGKAGADQVYGESGKDRLYGNGGADELWGGRGNDRLHGNANDDLLIGGGGRDRLHGNQGADQLHGKRGNDRLNGYAGDDELVGGRGDDRLNGGDGTDVCRGNGGTNVLVACE